MNSRRSDSEEASRISSKPNKRPGQDVFINITFSSGPEEIGGERGRRGEMQGKEKPGNCSLCIITDVQESRASNLVHADAV